ncbi:MAG: hypothetical protein AB1422_12050 [bacterium]
MMVGIGAITDAFFWFALFLIILAYANPKLTQRPNQIYLMLGLLFCLMWIGLFILFELPEMLK